MDTILITGASGFFGRNLAKTLSKEQSSFRCICVYHKNENLIPKVKDTRFEWVTADLMAIKDVQNLMSRYLPTCLVHFAWHVPPQNFWHSFENAGWVLATVNIFKEFCANGGKYFIGAGSLAEYDWTSSILKEDEICLRPQTLYGECKKSLFNLLKQIKNIYYPDVILSWARIGYFFGEDEPKNKFISVVTNKILTNSELLLLDKQTRRGYAHVKYLAEVFKRLVFDNKKDLVLNVNASYSHSLNEIINFIAKVLNKDSVKVFYGGYKSKTYEPLQMNVEVERLRNILGYEIKNTFFDDLKGVVEKIKEQ